MLETVEEAVQKATVHDIMRFAKHVLVEALELQLKAWRMVERLKAQRKHCGLARKQKITVLCEERLPNTIEEYSTFTYRSGCSFSKSLVMSVALECAAIFFFGRLRWQLLLSMLTILTRAHL